MMSGLPPLSPATHASSIAATREVVSGGATTATAAASPSAAQLSAAGLHATSLVPPALGVTHGSGAHTSSSSITTGGATGDSTMQESTSPAPRPSLPAKQGSRTSRRYRLNFMSNSVQFDTSTILEGFLYLGAKSVTVDREKLAAMNIRYIVGVSEDPPPDYGRDIEYMHIEVGDSATEDLSPYFLPACDFIERARAEGKSVLVHCTMGMSRSASLVLAYLVRHKNMSLAEAVLYVKQRRPVASPNAGFMAQLVRFEVDLRGKPTVDVERYASNRFGEVTMYQVAGC